MSNPDFFLLDETLWVVTVPTGIPIYDFDFRASFPCKTHHQQPEPQSPAALAEYIRRLVPTKVVARIGAFDPQNTGRVLGHLAVAHGLSHDSCCKRIQGSHSQLPRTFEIPRRRFRG